ncbi:MAG: tetratricopeptide repeat protein [Marinifilaceae bacterium]
MIKYILTIFFAFGTLFCHAKQQKRVENVKTQDAYENLNEEQRLQFDYMFIEGVRSSLLGDYQNAIQFFDNCLKLFPQSSAAKYELAQILLMNKDANTALELMRDAVKENPNNIWYKLLLADVYRQKSMIVEACNVYSQVLAKYPNKEDIYLMEASLYANIEQWDNAIDVLNRYEANFGISEPVSMEKLKMYSRLNDKKRASEELARLIKQYPDKSEYLGLLAELYFNTGDEKKGLKIVNKLMKENPSNGMIQFYLADYYKSKKNEAEYDKYTRAAFLNENIEADTKVQYLLNLIMNGDTVFVTEKKLDEYMDMLNAKYRNNLSVRALYSDFLKKDGKFQEATAELEYILSVDQSNYLIWEELMMLYNELRMTDSLYNKAMECMAFFPDEPMPYLLATLKLSMDKEYGQAVSLLTRGAGLVDNNNKMLKSQFYAYLGDTYYQLDLKDTAYAMYDKALVAEPNNILVLNNYAYFLTLNNGDMEKAERMSAKAVDADSDNATYLDTYAWVLYKRGDYSQALFYIKLAIEKEKEPSGVLFDHYGDILYKSGKPEEAKKNWIKALELGTEDDDSVKIKIDKGITE